MDRVRLGRALGVGARQAAKTLMDVADAATSPGPGGRAAPKTPTGRPASGAEAQRPRGEARASAYPNPAVVKAQGTKLGRTLWSPFAKFTSVLWLEVTGSFFAIFAVVLGHAAWRVRGALHEGVHSPEAGQLAVYTVVAGAFTYFSVSSFVRANRRQRR